MGVPRGPKLLSMGTQHPSMGTGSQARLPTHSLAPDADSSADFIIHFRFSIPTTCTIASLIGYHIPALTQYYSPSALTLIPHPPAMFPHIHLSFPLTSCRCRYSPTFFSLLLSSSVISSLLPSPLLHAASPSPLSSPLPRPSPHYLSPPNIVSQPATHGAPRTPSRGPGGPESEGGPSVSPELA